MWMYDFCVSKFMVNEFDWLEIVIGNVWVLGMKIHAKWTWLLGNCNWCECTIFAYQNSW